ncbi:Uncharacterised protein [Mycobacteroides abscessus subsp. abscessus]|nr:Uncharacterised protein [Mycobacteroides abscessus subsp. abscessus]
MHPRQCDEPPRIRQHGRTRERESTRRRPPARRCRDGFRDLLAEQNVDDGVEEGGVAEAVVVVDCQVAATEYDAQMPRWKRCQYVEQRQGIVGRWRGVDGVGQPVGRI